MLSPTDGLSKASFDRHSNLLSYKSVSCCAADEKVYTFPDVLFCLVEELGFSKVCSLWYSDRSWKYIQSCLFSFSQRRSFKCYDFMRSLISQGDLLIDTVSSHWMLDNRFSTLWFAVINSMWSQEDNVIHSFPFSTDIDISTLTSCNSFKLSSFWSPESFCHWSSLQYQILKVGYFF